MCLYQLNTKDIKDNIQTSYYKRGVEYYAQSRIKSITIANEFDDANDESVNIRSIVRGSSMYTQDIDIFRDGVEMIIEGACSCPIG